MKNYLGTVYNPNKRSKNNYPELLCKHVSEDILEKNTGLFVEFGCGPCQHLKIFQEIGFDVIGVDIDPKVKNYSKDIKIIINDVNKEKTTIKDNSIDIVFSKSFVEHLSDPDHFFLEAYRILKPGGKILTMVPDWESNMKIYFDDHTHKTPFTIFSLEDAYHMHGFKKVECKLFRQLPIVWKFPFLSFFCKIIAPFVSHRSNIKFLRWSKELMVVGLAIK